MAGSSLEEPQIPHSADHEGIALASKRSSLYGHENVSSQLFDPHGPSVISNLPLDKLWEATAGGGKSVHFHSHLAADIHTNPWSVGAGISITCQSLLWAIDRMESEKMLGILKEDMVKTALEEAGSLKPHLLILNFGRGSVGSTKSANMSNLRRKSPQPVAIPGEHEIKESVYELHEWLRKPKSPFRGFLAVLSGDGCFYAAHAAEKVARACITCKPADFEHFCRGALARRQSVQPPIARYDARWDVADLFQRPRKRLHLLR